MQWHTTQEEVGEIFGSLKPRLAVVTQLNLDDVSIVPIVSRIRSTYPQGILALAKDLDAFEV